MKSIVEKLDKLIDQVTEEITYKEEALENLQVARETLRDDHKLEQVISTLHSFRETNVLDW